MSPTYSQFVQNIIHMYINIENTKTNRENVNSCKLGKIYIEVFIPYLYLFCKSENISNKRSPKTS